MRHRIVQSASRRELEQVVGRLCDEGWRPVGQPMISAPADLRQPPHWGWVLYRSSVPVPLEILQILPPPDSRFSVEAAGA
jgi:hypothetical protein